MPKVIREEGGAVQHICHEVPISYNGAPQIRPQKYPFRELIPKPHYLPHPWTRPTYDAKGHLDPIRRFAAMTDRPTDACMYVRTDGPRESLTTIGRCATRGCDLIRIVYHIHSN